MLYTVQLRLRAGNFTSRLAEMRGWLDGQQLVPEGFQYRMEPDAVIIRADFKSPADAAAFEGAFGEMAR